MINVTKTFFPPLADYNRQLQRVWANGWLTNRGELVRELEAGLQQRLQTAEAPVLTANGTLPMQMALQKMAGCGEVITTPFSYVATTSCISWEHCRPVFVDIHPDYLTIDERQIQKAITPKTTAILATHVFGNPCHVEAIERLAEEHDLAVIYDAAHCFDVTYKGHSIFDYGDVSTCSFHATKLFHTGEGGAFFCRDEQWRQKLTLAHNFGHDGPSQFTGAGINAKMNELQAAMGLSVLPYMDRIIARRRAVVDRYDRQLDFSRLKTLRLRPGTDWNACYYPLIFESEPQLLHVLSALRAAGINPRRYFHPALNTLEYVPEQSMPVAESVAARVLCLPLFTDLAAADQKRIVECIHAQL